MLSVEVLVVPGGIKAGSGGREYLDLFASQMSQQSSAYAPQLNHSLSVCAGVATSN
jgi:hypothetical protein